MRTLKNYKVITINHKNTNLKNIGKFVLDCNDAEEVYSERLSYLKKHLCIDELLYLSTCNRVLFFLSMPQDITNSFLENMQKVLYPDMDHLDSIIENAHVFSGESAINHLLEVASSVDSLVIGEREILRQLREAYHQCRTNGLTGDEIRIAMRVAIEVAKDVYSNTKIGEKPVSVVSLALRQLLSQNIAKDARFLIIGAGQTNSLLCRMLLKYGYNNFYIYNRTLSKAEELALQVNGKAFAMKTLKAHNEGFDVLITCTSSTTAIVDIALYQSLLKNEKDKKILLDLSVPYNIDRKIAEEFESKCISIESLKELVEENKSFRSTEIGAAKKIIKHRLEDFSNLHHARQIELIMREVPEQIKAIREHAITEVFKDEVSCLNDEAQQLINRMMDYMEKRCIAVPIKTAKEHLAGVISTKK